MTRRTTRRLGEISIAPGPGIDQGHKCSCWPRPGDARPCTSQSCDPGCRACRVHGRPFYGHAELQYLEHGSGPLAAELDRLWRVRGAGKRRTVRAAAGHDAEGWAALRGAPLGSRDAAPGPHGDGAVPPGPAGPPTRA